ncbi:phage tail protein [Vibrio sp. JC009]|uniref:phage tail protein n=1 Tax=Vibrio sp. JC009 TaxID=2912314 RepID=UPI0023B1A2C5|nr:phage tail protein [Vibrio sp. JC009]WED23078.1 phage tail protein [Vibrio sp. JC009]
MSVQSEFVSVQPESRSLIEESMEYAWGAIIADLECPYPELKSPALTQDDFVSLLAGERGVMDWQATDTIDQQRTTAERAFQIHEKAGTRGGLKNALDALVFDSVISRGALPYSLDVEAFLLDTPLTEDSSRRVDSRINTYKSERDSIDVNISRQSQATVFVGVTTEQGITMTSEPFVPLGYTSSCLDRIAVYNHIRLISTSEPAIQ